MTSDDDNDVFLSFRKKEKNKKTSVLFICLLLFGTKRAFRIVQDNQEMT